MDFSVPILLDGATGTELARRGYDRGVCAEAWISEHPEAIREIQSGYVNAGSRVIYAPTFGANRVILGRHGKADRVSEYNHALVSLARESAGDRALVAGDISPTGLMLYPLGKARFEELVDIYTEQAAALEDAGVDLFVIETMMTLPEARAALLAVRRVSRKPAVVSFTCDKQGRTLTGTHVTAALCVMEGMGADAFGLNCSTGPREMLTQLRRLGEMTDLPLLAKPNAGLPRVENGVTVYDCPSEEFAGYASEFARCGVKLFGGCCGTDAEHIAALQKELAVLPPKTPRKDAGESILCATERRVFSVEKNPEIREILSCTDTLEEDMEELEGEEDELLGLRLENEAALEALEDAAVSLTRPVCFMTGDAVLLEGALRLYQGRALYRGELSEDALLPLVRAYGLIPV